MSNIKIGIIDIDEEGKEFTPQEIETFYNKNKPFFKKVNILVVCTQRSLSQGNTKHFQHLLKELLLQTNNTNFNTKNNNKKNTTQVIPFKFFSPISGSKLGLRTRVYTQGLDNDKLKVIFDSIDFSLTSSNEGAILCSIKYDGKDLIKVLNLYADIKNTNDKNINSKNSLRKNKITQIIREKYKNNIKKIYTCGKAYSSLFGNFLNNNNNIKTKRFNNNLEEIII